MNIQLFLVNPNLKKKAEVSFCYLGDAKTESDSCHCWMSTERKQNKKEGRK